jgi:hypothetical protein
LALFLVFSRQKPGDINEKNPKKNGEKPAKGAEQSHQNGFLTRVLAVFWIFPLPPSTPYPKKPKKETIRGERCLLYRGSVCSQPRGSSEYS